MGRKLLQNFLHSFNASVWNIISHPDNAILFIETRNESELLATFHALDMKSGAFLWRELLLDEPWWVGMSGAIDNILVLHAYQDGTDPEKKYLIGYDFRRQVELWRVSGFSWSYPEEGKLFGYLEEQGERKPAKLHLETGKIDWVPENGPPVMQPSAQDKNIGLQYPFHYTEESEYFGTVAEFLKMRIKSHPVKALEYLEYQDLIAISYYLYQDKTLANFLLVVNTQQEVLLHEKLQDGLEGVGMNTFFVMEDHLIYIKNKNQIVGYLLS